MKFFYLLFIICLLSVDAQRRSVKSELLSENEPPPKTARRGRARFTVTSDSPQIEEQKPEPPSRRIPSRRRPESRTETPPPAKGSYEVEEVVDEVPIETFRRNFKSKVLTESKFEAKNAPPSNTLFQPSTTENIDDIIKTIGEIDTTFSPLPESSSASSLEPSPSEILSSEIPNEITKIQPETTTPLTPKTTRRGNERSRGQVTPSPTVASRVRTRTRTNRRQEESASTTTAPRVINRSSRRRSEVASAETRASAESVEVPTRSRTGRKLPNRRTEDVKTEEGTNSRRASLRKNPEISNYVPIQTRTNTIRKSVEPDNEAQIPSRASTRKNIEPRRKPTESTTIRSRSRFRSEVPPVQVEQKLEVLPLFERESKTVKPVRKFVSRRRHLNSAEVVETSATENEVKIAPQPQKQSVVVETRTESNIRRRKVVKNVKPTKATTTTTTLNPSTTTTTLKPSTTTTTRKPSVHTRIVKESVVSEITEVTSKRTVTRRKTPTKSTKVEPPKFVARGSKTANVSNVKKNKSGLTSSEEEIDESDNYPEPFKQLIQAKKQKKESRPQHRLVTSSPVTKTTEKVVNSSPSTTTQIISTEAARQLEDSENELDPPKLRTTRRRFTQTTEKTVRTTRKSKFARSTVVPSHRFQANPEIEASTTKAFSPKPTRGLYSSRKTKESFAKSKSATTAQIPTPKKSNRYSSRYRNDASSRTAIRTSTNAPAYLPTIPTITPPTTSVKSPYQDKDLGVEVISFDDPVNTVPSANLVSGEYLASSTENHLTSSLVSASQTKTTEKPVSIIERIINSITAISTTDVPDVTRLTTPSPENSSKESAILKLATKKLDKTQTTQKTLTVTSEKPTTIIERILTSLSAIQADNTTDTKKFNSKQVGTNFNTISSPSTTPITRVTKSTLSAQFSTTVNPLFVLDDISNEQTLQKRTIDKLLELLNTLTTPHSQQLVVVTPKSTSYVVGTSAATITTTTQPTTTTTTTTTTEPTTTTTTQLFTSPSAGVSLESRANIPTSTVRYTQTPTITTLSTQPPTTTITATTTTTSTPFSSESISTTTDISNEISPLPLSIESAITDSTDSSTISTPPRESSTQSTIDSSTISSTEFNVDTDTAFAFPSTLPALVNFEVSPGSVSVFSANDLSNIITPEDSSSTTVAILGKTNFPEAVITTQSSTEVTPTQTTTLLPNSSDSNLTATVQSRFGDATTTENNPSTASTTISSTDPSTGSTTTNTVDSSTASTVSSSTDPSTVSTDTSTTLATATMAPPTTTLAASTTLSSSTTTLQSPTTTDSGDAINTTQDISSNIIDTTGSAEKSNTSTVNPPTNTTSRSSGRSGRLLNILQDPVQNSIETSTSRDKDYFIFAVLNNNTVLRKRPSRFPSKDTPYLIVGVYPNNTIVRKFPNGTLVPMEPIVRVSGFDTRENPPPLPEITSNQVTPDQGSRPDNKNLQTVEQNTIPPLEANPLSLSNVNNTSTTEATSSSTVSTVQANPISSTSTTEATASSTVSTVQANPLSISSTSSGTTSSSTSSSSTPSSTMSSTTPGTTTSTAPTATLPTLTEILNGRTVKAFNSIINISDLSKVQTLEVDPKMRQTTTTMLPTTTLSNRILDDTVASTATMLPTTTRPPPTTTTTTTTAPTTTAAPTTTVPPTTSTLPPTTTATFTTTKGTTVLPLTQPATTTYRSTTIFPSTTTFFPTFLTTLFSTLRPRRLSTEGPITIVTPISNRVPPTTTPRFEFSTNYADLITASSTRRTSRVTTVPTTTMPSTLPISTTVRSRRRGTTTTAPPTTTIFTTTLAPTLAARSARRSTEAPITTTDAAKKLRKLTEQQKKDLQTLAQLEQEQAAILKQLAFLTNLNFANTRTTTDKSDLANRIIALAVERDSDKKKTTTEAPSTESSRQGKKISSNEQNVEQLLKQLNIATPSTVTTYGKSEDAIIAALLKEQGIGPTTPKALEDIYALTTTTTKKPRTTTRRPGPLMQSLNWLLNVLAPPTTKRPKPKSKPKPKPKPQPNEEELLTHQPTHITPVVTPAPRRNIVSSLSQSDVAKLIKQLEAIQKNPDSNEKLDLSSIKSLQALLDSEEGVKVTSSGTTGTTTRITTPATTTVLTTTKKKKNKNRVVKSTTAIPLSVSNSLVDEVDSTTPTSSRVSLPPVKLRPVPGIEEDETLVRGQLVSAAVNVTRAISSFLGTALQDAALQFTKLFSSGSANLRDYIRNPALAVLTNSTAAN